MSNDTDNLSMPPGDATGTASLHGQFLLYRAENGQTKIDVRHGRCRCHQSLDSLLDLRLTDGGGRRFELPLQFGGFHKKGRFQHLLKMDGIMKLASWALRDELAVTVSPNFIVLMRSPQTGGIIPQWYRRAGGTWL